MEVFYCFSCPSQSNLLSGVPVSGRGDDGGSGTGFLDGGEPDVGCAVEVAGLALGTGASTAFQLTVKERKTTLNSYQHDFSPSSFLSTILLLNRVSYKAFMWCYKRFNSLQTTNVWQHLLEI